MAWCDHKAEPRRLRLRRRLRPMKLESSAKSMTRAPCAWCADVFFSSHPHSTQDEITRTKDEAREIIEVYHKQIVETKEKTLPELAVTESDCSSARKGGDLGYFGKGDMQQAFEEAAFALQPGEVSGIVETASGLHIIQRYVIFVVE